MPLLRQPTRALAVLSVAVLLATACGAASKSPTPARKTGMESMFEAQGQLLNDPKGALTLLRRLGVDSVRVFMPWNSLAPDSSSRSRPANFAASSPAAYPSASWAPYDGIIRAAAARGIEVDLTLEGGAPLWAAGTDVPSGASTSYEASWKPSAADYGNFVHAVATRYSGGYKTAPGTAPLPRVDYWSIWNEPNYGPQLAPQAIDHSTVEVSPSLYRGLLDAAWRSLQATGHGADRVLIGELAPRGITTGDNPGNFSGMVPLRFLRALYCVDSSFRELRGAEAAVRECPTTAAGSKRFAAQHPGLFKATGYAVHPYPQGGVPPNIATPYEPDYADLPSIARLESTLDEAQAVYGSAKRFSIYSTEFGYQTNPPEKIARAISPDLAAFYMNWAEYISWRDPRIASFDQYLLTDPPGGNFATGLYFASGAPKPLLSAFRLPIFMPIRKAGSGQSLELWGGVRAARYARSLTNAPQVAMIQFKASGAGAYKTLRSVSVTDPYGYFDTRVTPPSTGTLRLAWTYPHGAEIYSRTVSVTVR